MLIRSVAVSWRPAPWGRDGRAMLVRRGEMRINDSGQGLPSSCFGCAVTRTRQSRSQGFCIPERYTGGVGMNERPIHKRLQHWGWVGLIALMASLLVFATACGGDDEQQQQQQAAPAAAAAPAAQEEQQQEAPAAEPQQQEAQAVAEAKTGVVRIGSVQPLSAAASPSTASPKRPACCSQLSRSMKRAASWLVTHLHDRGRPTRRSL